MIGVENVQRKSKIELPIQFEESRGERQIQRVIENREGKKGVRKTQLTSATLRLKRY